MTEEEEGCASLCLVLVVEGSISRFRGGSSIGGGRKEWQEEIFFPFLFTKCSSLHNFA